MPADSVAIKHNNHRIHPCPKDKKIELLNLLILQNKALNIVVVSSENTENIQNGIENKEISVYDSKTFLETKDLTCDMLISFDVPQKAIVYVAMLSKATQKAVLLVDESEQNMLYPIEILLGRAIKQEKIQGFEYEIKEAVKKEVRKVSKPLTKDEIKEVAKKRYIEQTSEKKTEEVYDKKSFNKSEKFDKNKKKNNKFLGKDENGKAIFSGKSGERNHRYDGTPKEAPQSVKKITGKKILIKSLKKPKES